MTVVLITGNSEQRGIKNFMELMLRHLVGREVTFYFLPFAGHAQTRPGLDVALPHTYLIEGHNQISFGQRPRPDEAKPR